MSLNLTLRMKLAESSSACSLFNHLYLRQHHNKSICAHSARVAFQPWKQKGAHLNASVEKF